MLKVGTDVSQAMYNQLEGLQPQASWQFLANLQRNPLPLEGNQWSLPPAGTFERWVGFCRLQQAADSGYVAAFARGVTLQYQNELWVARTDADGVVWGAPIQTYVGTQYSQITHCSVVELASGMVGVVYRLGVGALNAGVVTWPTSHLFMLLLNTADLSIATGWAAPGNKLLAGSPLSGLNSCSNVHRVLSAQDSGRQNTYVVVAEFAGALHQLEYRTGSGGTVDWAHTDALWSNATLGADGLSRTRNNPFLCPADCTNSPAYEMELGYSALDTGTGKRDVYLLRSKDSGQTWNGTAQRVNPTASDGVTTYDRPTAAQRGSRNAENKDRAIMAYLKRTPSQVVNTAWAGNNSGKNGYNWVEVDSVLRRVYLVNRRLGYPSLQILDADSYIQVYNGTMVDPVNPSAPAQFGFVNGNYQWNQATPSAYDNFVVCAGQATYAGSICFGVFDYNKKDDPIAAWQPYFGGPPTGAYIGQPFIFGLPLGVLLSMKLVGTRCYCYICQDPSTGTGGHFGWWDVSTLAPQWNELFNFTTWNIGTNPGLTEISGAFAWEPTYVFTENQYETWEGQVYWDTDRQEVLFCCRSYNHDLTYPTPQTYTAFGERNLGCIVVCSYADGDAGLRRIYANDTATPNAQQTVVNTAALDNEQFRLNLASQPNGPTVGIYRVANFPKCGVFACARSNGKLYISPIVFNKIFSGGDPVRLYESLMEMDESLRWDDDPNKRGLTCTNLCGTPSCVSGLLDGNTNVLTEKEWHDSLNPPLGIAKFLDGRICMNYDNHGVRIFDPITRVVKSIDANPQQGQTPASILKGNDGSYSDPVNDSMPVHWSAYDPVAGRVFLAQGYYGAGTSNGTAAMGLTIIDEDGDIIKPRYVLLTGLNASTSTPALVSPEVDLTLADQEQDIFLKNAKSATDPGTSLVCGWAHQDQLSQLRKMYFEIEAPYATDPVPGVDISRYVRGQATVQTTIDNEPGRASFYLYKGNRFRPTNFRSNLCKYMTYGAVVQVRRGEQLTTSQTITVYGTASQEVRFDGTSGYQQGVYGAGARVGYDINNSTTHRGRMQVDFDLSGLPVGGTIQDITFTAYVDDTSQSPQTSVALYQATGPIPSYYTYAAQWAGANGGGLGLLGAMFPPATVGGTSAISMLSSDAGLKAAVAALFGTYVPFSVGFVGSNEAGPTNGYTSFRGVGDSNAAYRPRMVINFTAPVVTTEYVTIFTGFPQRPRQVSTFGDESLRSVTCLDVRDLMNKIEIISTGAIVGTAKYAIEQLVLRYLGWGTDRVLVPAELDGSNSQLTYSFVSKSLGDIIQSICLQYRYGLYVDRFNRIVPKKLEPKVDASGVDVLDYTTGTAVIDFDDDAGDADDTNRVIGIGQETTPSTVRLPLQRQDQITDPTVGSVGPDITHHNQGISTYVPPSGIVKFDPVSVSLPYTINNGGRNVFQFDRLNNLMATYSKDQLTNLRAMHDPNSSDETERYLYFKYDQCVKHYDDPPPLYPDGSSPPERGIYYRIYYTWLASGVADPITIYIYYAPLISYQLNFTGRADDVALRNQLGGKVVPVTFYIPNVQNEADANAWCAWYVRYLRWRRQAAGVTVGGHVVQEPGDTVKGYNPEDRIYLIGLLRSVVWNFMLPEQVNKAEVTTGGDRNANEMTLIVLPDHYAS